MIPPRLCIIGDVSGQADYHLGDEAMLEANLAMFRRLVPSIRFTVFSQDPIVFGEHEDPDLALPFLRAMKAERSQLGEMAVEAQRYAESLLEDNQRRELMRSEAERSAISLEQELESGASWAPRLDDPEPPSAVFT